MHRYPTSEPPRRDRTRSRSRGRRRGLPGLRRSGPGGARLPLFARIVIGVLALTGVVTAVGVGVLWPSGEVPEVPEHLEIATGSGAEVVDGTVTAVDYGECADPALQYSFRAEPSPEGGSCRQAVVEIESGPESGTYTLLQATGGPGEPTLDDGDGIRLTRTDAPPGQSPPGSGDRYAFDDFSRGLPLALWVAAGAVVVVAIGSWRGLRALIGVGIALAAIVGFMLPSLLDGHSPVLLALVTGSAILFAVLYLAHGVNLRSSAALLGTLVSLGLAAVLSWAAVETAHVTGLGEESALSVEAYLGSVSMSGLLLAGFIIGSLGVLNDVTVTQSATVFELARTDPDLRTADLFATAMRVGRDHIASMVYTLVLAYAGSALALLVIFASSTRSLSEVLTSDVVAVEVLRSTVGAIVVVLSVPLTTYVAALLTRGTPTATLAAGPGHGHVH